MKKSGKARQSLIIAAKIAVGSSAAIFIAELLGLDHYASAGIVTLLTLMTTKWESLRLSLLRLITFAVTMAVGALSFYLIDTDWISYGVFILLLVFITYLLGWTSTISVNAVIGTHLLLDGHFSAADVLNEFMLVIIGVIIAIVLNLFHDYHHQKKTVIADMRYIEAGMQKFVRAMKDAIVNGNRDAAAREEFEVLRQEIDGFIAEATDYQNNTFHSHPGYYISYFEMRQDQCNLIASLFDEIMLLDTAPYGPENVGFFFDRLEENIVEHSDPEPRIREISAFFEKNRADAPPEDMPEFESRALTYHILSTISLFWRYKQRFIQGLSERQIKEYRS